MAALAGWLSMQVLARPQNATVSALLKGNWGTEPVRIAIDIRQMSDYGVATYTRNVVRNLARMDHVNEYFLIGMVERLNEVGELAAQFSLRSASRATTGMRAAILISAARCAASSAT